MKRIIVLFALAACVLAAPAAMAQSDLGFKRIGGSVGFVSPEDLDGTFSLGVFVDHGMLAPHFGLESRLEYWGQSEGSFGAEVSISDVVLGARSKYFFEVANPQVRPFAGAGLGIHFIHAEVTIPAQFGFPEMTEEDSETRLGLDLGGGIATTLNPQMDLLAEGWFSIVEDVSQFSLRLGLAYRLGQ